MREGSSAFGERLVDRGARGRTPQGRIGSPRWRSRRDRRRGSPSFQALHHQETHTVVYYAFDLLHVDGRDLTITPLDERREVLSKVLKGLRLLRSEPLPGTPAQIEKAVREFHLEGVVAKRNSSRYEAGKRSRSWVKVKFNRRQEFVIGGSQAPCWRLRVVVGRLLRKPQADVRQEVYQVLKAIEQSRCPSRTCRAAGQGTGVRALPPRTAALRWVKPRIVVEVSFVEWTRDGLLRHPEFIGLRDDKSSREIRREES
jgi:bifunctional non-homologous end joining protein LigD